MRLAYNRTQYMGERRKMMAAWADWLDAMRLKACEKSNPFRNDAGFLDKTGPAYDKKLCETAGGPAARSMDEQRQAKRINFPHR